MGVLIGFAVGYVMGTKAGREGYEQVRDAIRDIRQSEEFGGLIHAVTGHLEHVLHEVNTRVVGDRGQLGR